MTDLDGAQLQNGLEDEDDDMSGSEAGPEEEKESSAEYSDGQLSEVSIENDVESDEDDEDGEEEDYVLDESDGGVEEQEDAVADEDDDDDENDVNGIEGGEDYGEAVGAVKIPNGHELDSEGAEGIGEPSYEDQESEAEGEDDDHNSEKSSNSSSSSTTADEFEDGSIAAEAVDADVANRNNCM